MIVWIIIAVILVLAIGFLATLLKIKNKAIDYQEEIKKAKSRVRVAQNKYVKALSNTTEALRQNANNQVAGMYVGGDSASASKYDTNTDLVANLAASYEHAQNLLNDLVAQYNKYIGTFPNSIFASILKCKPENYIDEANLEESTHLTGIDMNIV